MDFRKTFDQIPIEFDKYRPRYCEELFNKIISVIDLNVTKKILEIGPGTGQATEPFLKTGCEYTAIELGENFTAFMKDKFYAYPNFNIINDDFETFSFEPNTYDLVFSAATIQWIPEDIAYSKAFQMLKPGGYLAMFMTCSDERTENEELYNKIEDVYQKYFHVKQQYRCKFDYHNAVNYGFTNLTDLEWKNIRVLTADEYLSYISTHCEHITLEEPYKTKFYSGIKEAILDAGNKITIIDTLPLYLAQKPW
ncbi:methyltransferase [Lachnospiraceae bacterium KM106-2]|nr:methyltransferase [Lachnospiraceae bacterium KM106-2]